METGIQTIFGQPVADHDRHFRQGMQDHGDIRFELLFHLPAAENMNDVVKQVSVGVGHPFHGLLAPFLKEGIQFPAPTKFPKRNPFGRSTQAFAMKHMDEKRNSHPRVHVNLRREISACIDAKVLPEYLECQFSSRESSPHSFGRLAEIKAAHFGFQLLQVFLRILFISIPIIRFPCEPFNGLWVQLRALVNLSLPQEDRPGKGKTGLFAAFPAVRLV
jgi:hypothetical protein